MSKTFVCSICDLEHPVENGVEFRGQMICQGCLEEKTVICRECGDRIWRQENAGNARMPLCRDCYVDYYTNCTRCGCLLHTSVAQYLPQDTDEEIPYCHECYAELPQSRSIHDYYYKPRAIFYGDGNRYFGVELEIDDAGEDASNAWDLIQSANGDGQERIYCKHDGSLDDGFEIVTHPMTLNYHHSQMPWQDVLHSAISMGYRSHQATTCGLHVHVNRSAFGDTSWQQDEVIARILYFVEKHWEELLKFSRRTARQLDRWAARYGLMERPADILDHAKKGYHAGRYTCVNLLNDSTIEFRIFRGTLKYNTLLATLQMVDRICDAALFLSDDEMKALSWTTFAAGCQQPELVQYLKERRLYINEPVESEVEV